jgi:nicotinamidase-related amidase
MMMPSKIGLMDHSRPFLHYLDDWYASLPSVPLAEIVGGAPQHVALFSIDMVNGFCTEGPLASERVGALVKPVGALFKHAYDLGVRAFVLAQDTHDPNTPEFHAYPPHCIAGTAESQAVAELRSLPFASEMTTIEKNSLSVEIGTTLGAWLHAHQHIHTFIVVGDCSDLCVYSAAMYLRLSANALNLQRRIIVPADAVDTFDTPVSVARELGIKAHDADLHHVLFLHHMAMNGIEVVGHLV